MRVAYVEVRRIVLLVVNIANKPVIFVVSQRSGRFFSKVKKLVLVKNLLVTIAMLIFIAYIHVIIFLL